MSHPPVPSEPEGWPSDATLDRLVGDWSIYQRLKGHKTSTDDVLTAWLAVHTALNTVPHRYLDLGCGVGSVLLLTSHRLRPRFALGVEAQAQSFLLAQATLEQLPPGPAIEVRRADFRELSIPDPGEAFDLITGSPPYFPLGTGVTPKDYQRLACRFEVRGGAKAYVDTANKMLAPGGRIILVHQTAHASRVLDAAAEASLCLHTRVDVRMREDRAQPFLTVFEFRREEGETTSMSFAIRDTNGNVSTRYRAAREELGLQTRD